MKVRFLLFLFSILMLSSCDEDSSQEMNSTLAMPGPETTGPTDPSALVVSDDGLTVDENWSEGGSGTEEDPFIVENLDIAGILKIRTSNVIVRNFRVVSSPNTYPVQTNFEGVSNVVLEDGEISGEDISSAAIIVRDGATLRRLNLHSTGGDGVKVQGDNFVMESCWVHNLGSGEGAHADGVQGTVNGVNSRWSNHVYRGNFFDMAVDELADDHKANATIFLHANDEGAGIDGILVEDNWLIGGNYSLQIFEGMTDVTVRNNKFGRVDKEVRFGNLRINSPAEIENNTYFDTGELVVD